MSDHYFFFEICKSVNPDAYRPHGPRPWGGGVQSTSSAPPPPEMTNEVEWPLNSRCCRSPSCPERYTLNFYRRSRESHCAINFRLPAAYLRSRHGCSGTVPRLYFDLIFHSLTTPRPRGGNRHSVLAPKIGRKPKRSHVGHFSSHLNSVTCNALAPWQEDCICKWASSSFTLHVGYLSVKQ